MEAYIFRKLDSGDFPAIRALFTSVFTKEPWNDDWSDAAQLDAYLRDLTAQGNSLAFGLFEGGELVGLSLGHIRHWCTGTEYMIDELCIHAARQGRGVGTLFVGAIEKACGELGITRLFLLTDKDVPAYQFYRKLGFYELDSNIAFAKKLK